MITETTYDILHKEYSKTLPRAKPLVKNVQAEYLYRLKEKKQISQFADQAIEQINSSIDHPNIDSISQIEADIQRNNQP